MVFIDICGILIIALYCVSGYLIGFQKGMTRFFIFLITVIAGFLLADIFSSFAYNYDFSNHNIKISGMRLRTIPGLLRSFVAIYFPDFAKYVNEAHYFNLLINNISKAIFRVGFLIVWIILAVSIVDFIFLTRKGLNFKSETKSNSFSGLALGCLQSLILLLMIFSPLKGIYDLKTSLENKHDNSPSSFTMKLSGNFIFDRVFKIDYKGEEIRFRKDIENLQTLQENIQDYEEILLILEDLESTELVSAALIEFYLLSNNVKLNDDMISSIGKISYRNELKHLKNAYQLFKELDLKERNILNWDENIIKEIGNNLSKCSFINLVCPYIINDYFPDYLNLIGDINTKNILWTNEVRIYSEIFVILKNLEINNFKIKDLKYDEKMYLDLVRLLFESDLFINNQQVLIDYFTKAFVPEEIHFLQINNISETELANILLFIGFLSENDYFEEEFSWTAFLNDQNVEKMVEYISQSNILIENLDKVLSVLFLESVFEIKTIILPDINWKSQAGKTELKCFFELLRIFNVKQKYQKEVLIYTDAFLEKKEISALIYLNSGPIIDYLVRNSLGKDFNYLEPNNWDAKAAQTEIIQLIKIYRELVKSEVLYTNSLKNLCEEDLSNFALVLNGSELLRLNIDSILNYIILKSKLPFSNINLSVNLTESDIFDLLVAGKILENVKNEKALFLMESEDIDKILNSKILYLIIKNYLYQLASEGFLIIDFGYEDEAWEEEMKNFFDGVKLIIEKNKSIGIRNLDLNIVKNITTGYIGEESDDLTIILKSKMLLDTIITNIKRLKRNPNTGEGVLIINIYEEDWLDWPPPIARPGE